MYVSNLVTPSENVRIFRDTVCEPEIIACLTTVSKNFTIIAAILLSLLYDFWGWLRRFPLPQKVWFSVVPTSKYFRDVSSYRVTGELERCLVNHWAVSKREDNFSIRPGGHIISIPVILRVCVVTPLHFCLWYEIFYCFIITTTDHWEHKDTQVLVYSAVIADCLFYYYYYYWELSCLRAVVVSGWVPT